ncbi:hypothetical protein CUN61_29955 [Pseudomonas arsenicoxydans]|uniref:Uncharacterized protein n=1 Tax=Pseudomonas arsenicoxydans TaxID=702115 RepID=A0A4P6GAK4_9PSED|nr:hypothetical protein CUN61_29955 [Pseudomonas arsenicoxydans]
MLVCLLVGRGHIHYLGNGGYWFRSYSGSLGRAPSNQALAPLTYGLPTGQIKIKIKSGRRANARPDEW